MDPVDRFSRPLRDLRVSVTDRCNFRCIYCMPREVFGTDYPFLPRDELLSFEEITRVVGVFLQLGVEKVRLTGGEPLVRKNIEGLVEQIARLEGIQDLTLTTNGSLLRSKADALKAAGLARVTVSLDALDDTIFAQMNDAKFSVARVLDGIEAAMEAGLSPVKVNMVVKRGVNDGEILPMAEHFRSTGVILRFIEFMDVGTTNGWRMDDVVPASTIRETIDSRWPLESMDALRPGDVATRYRYSDGQGEVGIISSISAPFCSACVRARLSAKGELYTCLFGSKGHDLRALLRSGASDDDLLDVISKVWTNRGDRYSEIRSAATKDIRRVEMSYIGG